MVSWLSYILNALRNDSFICTILRLHTWTSAGAVNSPDVPSEVLLDLLSGGQRYPEEGLGFKFIMLLLDLRCASVKHKVQFQTRHYSS